MGDTHCAQGRELCQGQASAHPGDPDSYCHQHHTRGLHHYDPDGFPCLGPECKGQPEPESIPVNLPFARLPVSENDLGLAGPTGVVPDGAIQPPLDPLRGVQPDGVCVTCNERHAKDAQCPKREPGIVERCRATAANVQAWAVGKPPDSLRAVVLHDLREAAAHIEGLEARLPTLSEALVKERAERARLEAENQRLREALEQIKREHHADTRCARIASRVLTKTP